MEFHVTRRVYNTFLFKKDRYRFRKNCPLQIVCFGLNVGNLQQRYGKDRCCKHEAKTIFGTHKVACNDNLNHVKDAMKELSSPLTFFYKYIFILLWVIGFALGTHEVLLDGPDNPRWGQYMIVWATFAVFIFFSSGNVKKVTMRNNKIQISNFLRTEEIDISDIESVDGSTYLSPRFVWFNLKKPCSFGTKISFIPAIRKSKGIGKHPMVQELAKELNL